MKSNNKKIFRRILKQLKNYKIWIFLTVLLALLTVAGQLTIPILFGKIINLLDFSKVPFNKSLPEILIIFIAIGGIVAFTCLMQWLMNIINNFITFNVVRDIRNEAFVHIQELPLKYLDSHSYGDIISRNIADVDTFADGLLMGFTQLFTGILTIIGTIVIMFVLNWIIALVVFVLTPLSLFVAKFIASRTYKFFRRTSEIRDRKSVV